MKVIHAVSVMNRAGQETFIMNVYRNIDREKIQFDFQCSVHQPGDFDEEIKKMGGNVLYLPSNTIKNPIFKYFADIRNQYQFFKKHPGYQVFHIHTYHAFDAWLGIVGAKMAGVKHICLHSHNTQGLHPELHKIFRFFLNHMKITRFACSYAAGEWMYGEKFMQQGKAEVIKNGIQVSDFVFDENRREATKKVMNLDDKFVVGHIGRFNYQKNHKFLLQVFKEIQKQQENAILLLLGTGELEEQVKVQAVNLGIQDAIQFLGVRSDVIDILFAMDVFVFPSLFEGLSVVAIEDQAAGTPMLAADTLTEETKITDSLCFCSLEASPKLWAQKAIELGKLAHQNNQDAIIRSGYDIKATAGRLSEVYLKWSE